MAVAVEEHGREIVEVYLQAMRKGDWRAAEALMSRIYGKPEETVRQVETNPALPVLKSMTSTRSLSSSDAYKATSSPTRRRRCRWSKPFRRPHSPTHPREAPTRFGVSESQSRGRPGVRGLDSAHHRHRAAAPRTRRRRELFLATSKVEDFNRWWSVFTTTSLEKRKQHGSKGSHTFRDPNEEGRVWVLFDWDAEGWQNFISDPEVPAILQEAGHASRPQIAELAGQLDG
jgi:hypothetical protein